jgi:hypothetical protein
LKKKNPGLCISGGLTIGLLKAAIKKAGLQEEESGELLLKGYQEIHNCFSPVSV